MQAPEASEKKKRPVKEIVVIKNTYDYQRMKLDRLMKNPVSSSKCHCALYLFALNLCQLQLL